MSRKVTVIGAGNVGATIAYTLSLGDIASQIVVVDINKEKVEGEVMDIVQGTSFREPISVIAGDYSDAADSDIVIITSGIGRKPGQSRIDLAQTNVNIMKDIAPKIAAVAPNALYVIVSNPVDIMTYVFTKVSGIPENQVIGSGTILDTARLRYDLSHRYNIAQKNIHAYVYGEHGDTSFIPWSLAQISGCPLSEYEDMVVKQCATKDRLDPEQTLKYVQKSGGEIIAKKGATFYAVSAAAQHPTEAAMTLECLSSEGYRIITPILFEVTMKTRYTTDPTAAKTFDMARAGVSFDLGRIYSDALGNLTYSIFRNCICKNNPNFSRTFNASRDTINTKLDEMMAAFGK